MNKFAQLLSFLSNPLFVLLIVPYVLVYRFTSDSAYAFKWTLFSLLFLLAAALFVYYQVRKRVFTDMDVSKREQRPLLFGMIGVMTGLYLLTLYMFNAPPILFLTVWGILVGVIVATIVNMWIKASLHVGTLTAVLLTVYKLYELPIYIFLFIPLVAWPRVTVKRHTEKEVVVGGVFGIVLTFFMYILLKYVYRITL